MPKRKSNFLDEYLGEVISFGGVWMPRGQVIATMQREGHAQQNIDRWLQGQEFAQRLRKRQAANDEGGATA